MNDVMKRKLFEGLPSFMVLMADVQVRADMWMWRIQSVLWFMLEVRR